MTDDTDMILYNAFHLAARQIDHDADAVLMDPEPRYHLTQALGMLMSEVSEELYCAGWLDGLEDDLPYALLRGQEPDAPPMIAWAGTDKEAQLLMRSIAQGLGHWAKYEWYERGEQYVPYVPKCLREQGK